MAKDAIQNLKRSKGGRGANERQSLTQDVATNNPTSLVGPRIHQDSKATAMILKATYLIVATINKRKYLFTL